MSRKPPKPKPKPSARVQPLSTDPKVLSDFRRGAAAKPAATPARKKGQP